MKCLDECSQLPLVRFVLRYTDSSSDGSCSRGKVQAQLALATSRSYGIP